MAVLKSWLLIKTNTFCRDNICVAAIFATSVGKERNCVCIDISRYLSQIGYFQIPINSGKKSQLKSFQKLSCRHP